MTHREHSEFDEPIDPLTPDELARVDQPMETWMAELTHAALAETESETVVPRDAMWAAIERTRAEANRSAHVLPFRKRTSHLLTHPYTLVAMGMAATLLIGIGIGRYERRSTAALSPVAHQAPARADSVPTEQGIPTPLQVAMIEHLARTEALLTTVRYDRSNGRVAPDVSSWARELLGTTRLLLDDPAMRDVRTRQLLQDMELVLVQVMQLRDSSPSQTREAPIETLRETNLLPRLRAAHMPAQNSSAEHLSRGISE